LIPAGTERWRLPDGIDEWLPDASRRLETLRRRFIDLGTSWGFEPVMPPMIEYLDALLTGTGEVLDLQTFTLIDQQDGRALGVRADMTPQVARIDAHALGRDAPTRLLYTGTVLRARTDAAGGSRNPLQFGAELFGHGGLQSDLEMCRLMLESVLLSGVEPGALTLSLGHVGVYAGLVDEAGLDGESEQRLHDAMVRGSVPDVQRITAAATEHGHGAAWRALGALPSLRGEPSMLADARERLAGRAARVTQALDTLAGTVAGLAISHPEVGLHIDLGDLRGYRYHTGMLFAVHGAAGEALARGGRYDAIGEAFGTGKGRPATGFSGELARLMACQATPDALPATERRAILLRDPTADGAWDAARALRADGECVISSLTQDPVDASIDRELVRFASGWTVRPLTAS